MESAANTKFSFDNFEIDTHHRLLSKSGETINLNPKTFDLLLALIEREGEVVSKNDLLDCVWADQFVEENNLTVHVAALRKALGEKKGEHRFIVTNPGRGYTFVAKICRVEIEKSKVTEDFRQSPIDDYFSERDFSNGNKSDEIVIESRKISRVLIEEEVIEEDEFPAEKIITTPLISNRTENHHGFSRKILYALGSILGAILIFVVAGFLFRQSGSSAESKSFSIAKLTTSGKISNATLSPDSKYAVYSQIESDGESLWLRHIVTGSQTPVLSAKPVKYIGLAIAPDGNSIYATTFAANVADPQIWRVPLLGGAIEEIKNITTGAAISFSPDGNRIAFTESRSSQKETQLLIADATGANKQILSRAADDARSFPNFNVNPVAWSPDGNSIACAIEEKNAGGAKQTGILLVNPIDRSERFISEKRWDYIEHLAWVDAENLAFIAYTREPWQGQIWAISKTSGAARQITNDLNNYSWLASANGNLLTVRKNSVSHLSIADFDENLAQFAPREIYQESGIIDTTAFTADGVIIYSSSQNGKREIWRVGQDGKNPQQLTVNSNISFGLSVSPIDDSIVFSANENGRHFLKLVDENGKNARQLTEGAEDVYPNFMADGQSVIFQNGLDNKIITLWRVSLADKNPVQLTQTHAIHPAISKDGMQTAFYFMDAETDGLWRVGLISSADGSFLSKLSFPKAVTERRMRWHPNGKFIGQILYEGENINLLLLPIGGDSQIVSGLGKGDVNWFDFSNDGKQIVVSHTTETQDVVFLTK